MTCYVCPNCGVSLDEFKPVAFGNIALLDRGHLVFNGERLNLPRSQHEVVEALILAEGRALTISHLAEYLGGDIFDQTIAVYIGRARSKFREIEPDFDQIVSVKGFKAYKWSFKMPEALAEQTAIH